MVDKEQDKEDKSSAQLTGRELIILVIFAPVVFTWLFLGARIIWSASSNAQTLDSIEGLLTALAVLTIPVSAGLGELWKLGGKKDE
jgi:hypothetical protein